MKLRLSDPAAQPTATSVPALRPPTLTTAGSAARAAVRAAALACVAGLALGGCGLLSSGAGDTPAAAAAPTVTPTVADSSAAGAATSGMGSVKDSGDLPDPCTLLSRREITGLTGRDVTQIDKDDAGAGEATRFCQWQQDGGQLALFLSRTTADSFEVSMSDADLVDGVGDEDAYQLAGHLYVLYGSVEIDVYAHGSSEAQNLGDAKEVAKVVMPRI